MPNSRKRHHSRSRSKSSDRSNDLEYKRKKYDEKSHDEGHRNNNSNENYSRKRSLSSEREVENGTTKEIQQEDEKTSHAANIVTPDVEDIKQPGTKEERNLDDETGEKQSEEFTECEAHTSNEDEKKREVENGTTMEIQQMDEKTTQAANVVTLDVEDIKQPETKEEKNLDDETAEKQSEDFTQCDAHTSNEDDKKENGDLNKTVDILDSSSESKSTKQERLECMEIDEDGDQSETEKTATKVNVEVEESDKSTSEDDRTKLKTVITPLTTPNKKLTPKKLQKKLESEKKRLERQKEKEDKEKKKNEERERILQEKQKRKEEKQKEIEQKQKEKEVKEEQRKKEKEEKDEQRRKEKEEKELKRKEKEEKEEMKRKEREQEKIKKQQEIDEKNKEKLKEEEKKKKTAALFVNFFVPIKADGQEEKKQESTIESNFMAFEIKSDMKLPLPRRDSLTEEEKETLDTFLRDPSEEMSYLKDLKKCNKIRKCGKTWPYEESVDDDVTIVDLGETICEDKSTLQKFRAKFFKFHENRRPAYYGTWRKKSKTISARKPLSTDEELLNYEEDSDDDWEEEEQGESLNGSDDEAEKENEDEKDDYEVDNDFFVPHGHLSEDEVDDEEDARLSPESLKQKLKLLKEEFDQDMNSKTNKLKPRSVGCVWYNKDGSNVDDALNRYLQPLAIISNGQILIKKRSEILVNQKYRKNKVSKELDPEHVPLFLKIVQGNSNKKAVVVDQFIQHMEKNGYSVMTSKSHLIKMLKQLATWKKCSDSGPMKNKFGWFVNKEIETSNEDP